MRGFPFVLMWCQIDLKKMPLGKLSKKQIESAYKVLTELQQVNTLYTSFIYCIQSPAGRLV